MTSLHSVIKFPLTTEKSVRVMEAENKLIFIVDRQASKHEIKKAVEEMFKVKVVKVNTTILPSGEKKAYVALAAETPAIDVATKLGLI
ncbi:MAG: 50S ribosomal protein L23 [Candidatus Nanoarchaeia archaeon]|nr:50S ribosomal protein L23 [Candidatus Nanoarchaeia archaeon]